METLGALPSTEPHLRANQGGCANGFAVRNPRVALWALPKVTFRFEGKPRASPREFAAFRGPISESCSVWKRRHNLGPIRDLEHRNSHEQVCESQLANVCLLLCSGFPLPNSEPPNSFNGTRQSIATEG